MLFLFEKCIKYIRVLIILKVYIYLFIFICKCENRSKILSSGIVTLYIQCGTLNLNRLKDYIKMDCSFMWYEKIKIFI